VRLFGRIRKNRKGASAQEIFKQAFMFFADGTSRIWPISMNCKKIWGTPRLSKLRPAA